MNQTVLEVLRVLAIILSLAVYLATAIFILVVAAHVGSPSLALFGVVYAAAALTFVNY